MTAFRIAATRDDVPLPFPRGALDRLSRAEAGLAAAVADDVGGRDDDLHTDDPAQLRLWLADFIQRLPVHPSQGEI